MYIYRPQRSCEGYVFTPVCLSTGGMGGLPQCMLGYHHPPGADHPPSRWLLLRTVRILLECILVLTSNSNKFLSIYNPTLEQKKIPKIFLQNYVRKVKDVLATLVLENVRAPIHIFHKTIIPCTQVNWYICRIMLQ